MEEVHFIKCETGWTPDTEESLKYEQDVQLPCADLLDVKAEAYLKSDDQGDDEDISDSVNEELIIQDVKEEPGDDDLDSGTFQNEVSSIMEEAHFVKCEPGWTCGTQELSTFDSDVRLPCISPVKVKVEPCQNSDYAMDGGEIADSIKEELEIENMKEEPSNDDIGGPVPNEMQSLLYPAATETNEAKACNTTNATNGGEELLKAASLGKNSNEFHRSRYECKECGKLCQSSAKLSRHISTHTEEGEIACKECSRTFKNKVGLRTHLKWHIGKQRNLCTTCGKTFTRKRQLNRHLKLHTSERTLACPTCGKTFMTDKSLRRHITVHTGERRTQCTTCGKSYCSSWSLYRHAITHSKDKHFECLKCRRNFYSKQDLLKHVPKHNDEKPFLCAICERTFCSKWNLVVHMSKHNDEQLSNCT